MLCHWRRRHFKGVEILLLEKREGASETTAKRVRDTPVAQHERAPCSFSSKRYIGVRATLLGLAAAAAALTQGWRPAGGGPPGDPDPDTACPHTVPASVRLEDRDRRVIGFQRSVPVRDPERPIDVRTLRTWIRRHHHTRHICRVSHIRDACKGTRACYRAV